MSHQDHLLAAIAELGALRHLLVHAIALRLVEEPAPLQALDAIGWQLSAVPTQPPASGHNFDPAVSDLLAALTDERTQSLVEEVRARLALFVAARQ